MAVPSKKSILFFFLLLYSLPSVLTANEDLNTISPAKINKYLQTGKYSYYVEDPHKSFTASSLYSEIEQNDMSRWTKSQKKNLLFGFSPNPYWIYFKINFNNLDSSLYALELDYPHIDFIEIYLFTHKTLQYSAQGGDRFPVSHRKVFYRNMVYEFPEDLKEIELLIKVQTEGSLTIPLYLWKISSIRTKITREMFILGIYYGFLVIIILFNIQMYVSIRDLNYIYYSFWILGYGGYQFSINGLGYQFLWSSFPVLTNRITAVLMFFGITWAFQFGRSFLNTKVLFPKVDSILKIVVLIMGVLTLCSLVINYQTMVRLGAFSTILLSTSMFSLSLASLFKGYKPARFYTVAWSFLFFGVTIYALKAFGLVPENNFTAWAQQAGSAFEVVILSIALADRINTINTEKKKAIQSKNSELLEYNDKLNEAINRILVSEERNRMLLEGTDDIVFTMDESCRILSINKAVKKILRQNPENIIQKSIYEFLHDDREGGLSVTHSNMKERIEHLLKTREGVEFKTSFISPIKSEPLELNLKMEYINIAGRNEIFGRAMSVKNDALMKYFKGESQKLEIDNRLMNVEDVGFRITRNLIKYYNQSEVKVIRTAVREILFNAIEHGNLNITYKEKTEATINDNYFELISARQRDAKYKDRKVNIEYSITAEKIIYTIKDDGDGFDHKKILSEGTMEANNQMLSHGRGITMTKQVFDELIYSEKGNQVTLIKYNKSTNS
jgi:anti-sigma regulatory factor (Ser/Thr protein kinase)/PAS domain-containing protein